MTILILLILAAVAVWSPPRIRGQHSAAVIFAIVLSHALIIATLVAAVVILELRP